MSAIALMATFTAGLSTSVGPCVAPRYLALTAIVARSNGPERWVRIVCFVAGLVACYVLLATAASLLAHVAALSRIIYALLALGFLIFGCNALLVRSVCSHAVHGRASSSATLLAGCVLGLVVSPCCTPVMAMIATIGAASASPTNALLGAASFAAGHLAPLTTIGFGFGGFDRIVPGSTLRDAASTVGGGLSLALAAYYGLAA